MIDYNRLDVAVINPDGMECVLDAGSERDGQTVTCCYTPRIGGIVRKFYILGEYTGKWVFTFYPK